MEMIKSQKLTMISMASSIDVISIYAPDLKIICMFAKNDVRFSKLLSMILKWKTFSYVMYGDWL